MDSISMDSTKGGSPGIFNFEGQRSRRVACQDIEGLKRADFYATAVHQRGCLIATVVSSGLQFAVQHATLFDVGIGQSATGAQFPANFLFTEPDTNVEEDGVVAPEGHVFVAKSAGVYAGRPFVDNSGSESYPEWLETYTLPALEALFDRAAVILYPNGERNGTYSLGALSMNPSFRGLKASDTLPQANPATPGLPVPLDAELTMANEHFTARLDIPRIVTVPARATIAAATCYFPFTLLFEGRPQPR